MSLGRAKAGEEQTSKTIAAYPAIPKPDDVSSTATISIKSSGHLEYVIRVHETCLDGVTNINSEVDGLDYLEVTIGGLDYLEKDMDSMNGLVERCNE